MPTLTVSIDNARNDKGQFIIVIYDSQSSWLGEDPNDPYKTVKQRVSVGATMTAQVDSGTYGFIVLHDENMNDDLDKGILPKEGLGASNNARMTLRGPRWRDAKFDVTGDKSMSVRLKYWG